VSTVWDGMQQPTREPAPDAVATVRREGRAPHLRVEQLRAYILVPVVAHIHLVLELVEGVPVEAHRPRARSEGVRAGATTRCDSGWRIPNADANVATSGPRALNAFFGERAAYRAALPP
jgi:hypothetical protein